MPEFAKQVSRWICFLVFILISAISSGKERLVFRQLGIRDGLSNGSIKSIFQDREGFIWFGTIGGLNKYDGISFEVFTHKEDDRSSVSVDDISCIFEDSDGVIWIGTFGGGLNKFTQETNRFTSFQTSIEEGSISSNEINFIFEDSHKQLWIGTENGLNKFDRSINSFTCYILNPENPYSISSKSVRAIYEDKDEFLWIGTFGGGLNMFDPKTQVFTHFKPDAGITNSISSAFVLDIEPFFDKLLIGTNGGGLQIFNKKARSFRDFFSECSEEYQDIQVIKDIYTDSEGNVWIGTDGDGLIKIIPIKSDKDYTFSVSRYTYSSQMRSSISSNAIYKIYEDAQKNLWIGTAWNGISILEHSPDNIEFYYSDIEGMDPLPVLSVYAEDKKNLWIGSDGRGIYHYNSVTGEVLNFSAETTGNEALDYIQFIQPGKNEELWIGTYANGLINLNPLTKKIVSYRHDPADPNSIGHNDVRTIKQDKKGNLWVATWGGGLSYFDISSRTFTNYLHDENNPSSINNNNVLAIEEAANGKLWLGTFGGGLNLFDPEYGSSIAFRYTKNDTNSLSGNNILCLHKDEQGNLWIGTWGAGLTRFNIIAQEFIRFDHSNGLINNTVTAIEEDKNGTLWLSTKKGICSLDPQTNQIRQLNFNRKERVNEFHINSSFSDSFGKLYFGGIEGLVAFNPQSLTDNIEEVKVKFTGFELFNKKVELGKDSPLKEHIAYADKIVLNHKQSVFTFIFSAMDFPFSDNCQYAVMMEGFEDNWREIGTRNSATYTNLSPGSYIFKVKARYANAEWSDSFTSIAVEVYPPVWKTWYAITFYVFIFTLLLYAFQRYTFIWAKLRNNLKIEKLKREQEANLHKLKLRFFTNISHELRTPLTLILDPLNNLIEGGRGGSEVQRPLKIIKKNTGRLLQLINELLDFRRIEQGKVSLHVAEGNIVKFTHEVFLAFREFARIHSIKYEFQSELSVIKVWFDRTQMEKVIYNLLSNAFKHTPENGQITISVKGGEETVEITVQDTGEGIPADQLDTVFERFYQTDRSSPEKYAGFGIGLSIAKELVKMHNGEIKVESTPGKGSIFTITLKLGRNHLSDEVIIRNYKSSEKLESYSVVIDDEEISPVKPTDEKSVITQRLLIVEDNTDLRTYLAECMATGFDVITAENGERGIELALEEIPDIIISDVMMPEKDGIELCRTLKSDIRTSHIPIILLTARTAEIFKLEGFETGADDYLTKPFRLNELNARIRNLLENRERLRQKFVKEALMQPREVIVDSPDEKFLMGLMEIIEEHIDQPELNVELITGRMGMSHSVVYKKIKALTGNTLVEFIREQRLKRAAQLLSQQKLSVKEICYEVGFTDRRYFSQMFKKKYNVTPSDYSREVSKNKS